VAEIVAQENVHRRIAGRIKQGKRWIDENGQKKRQTKKKREGEQ